MEKVHDIVIHSHLVLHYFHKYISYLFEQRTDENAASTERRYTVLHVIIRE